MTFVSTEGRASATTFRNALFAGLAPDGGLYIPASLPSMRQAFLDALPTLSLHRIGEAVLSHFIDDIPPEEIHRILQRAWTFPIPLVHLEDDIFLLELFHGPTLAFKDVGARFLAHTLSYYLEASNQDLAIAVATSGDTGSAVAHGFFSVPRTTVYVLYPSGKISALQEQQITTLGGNVRALEVDGTFDDCQRIVKHVLADPEVLKARNLTTANSINIGRLLPQMGYYIWCIAQWQRQFQSGTRQPEPTVVVPSGNFGNLTAGVYARAMGAPIARFIAATNVNDAGGAYLRSGHYAPRTAVQTYSNAMDVGNPSNVARLRSQFHDNVEEIHRWVDAVSIGEDDTLRQIRLTYERTGKVLDPHTAVGLAAARRQPRSLPVIVTSTAHPAKFPDVIQRALGIRIPLPEGLLDSFRRPKSSVQLPGTYESFKRLVMHEQ